MTRFTPDPIFYSVEYTPTKLRATEDEIARIYDAAYRGLSGDTLAIKSGFLPKDFMMLLQADPAVEKAVLTARADCEAAISGALIQNALGGETKAAHIALTHKFGWKPERADVDSTHEIKIVVENGQDDPPLLD